MKKWLLVILLLIVFISGCVNRDEDKIKPTISNNALDMSIKIKEKDEKRRILPGSTIRMLVTLKNQVEKPTENVDLKIINPYGIQISKVDCGSGCTCEWPTTSSDCPTIPGTSCGYNGCHYDSIQEQDEVEITFGLKIPSEEEISSMGRTLKPKIMLEYNYSGTSALYIPIYKQEEIPKEPKKDFTQTPGPIHVSIDSDDWVREGDLFPLYVNVKDVVNPSGKITIDKSRFSMSVNHVEINESYGRCDFKKSGDHYIPKEDIKLPLENPLVCTLKAEKPKAPMVKASIVIEYSYRYRVEKTETIRVEKAFLGIF